MKTKIFCDSADYKNIKFLNSKSIGGGFTTNPSLMRLAGAKNYKDVLVVSQKKQYTEILEILKNNGPYSNEAQRKVFASEAFNLSSHYDTLIFKFLNSKDKPIFNIFWSQLFKKLS